MPAETTNKFKRDKRNITRLRDVVTSLIDSGQGKWGGGERIKYLKS